MKKIITVLLALLLAFGTIGYGWAEGSGTAGETEMNASENVSAETVEEETEAEAMTETPAEDAEDEEADNEDDMAEDDEDDSEADDSTANEDEDDDEEDEDIELETTLDPEDANELTGKWYGMISSMILTLELNGDGSYSLRFAGEGHEGKWTYEDGIVTLDGENGTTLETSGDVLIWNEEQLSREPDPDDIFIPGDVLTGDKVKPEDFNGYWVSWYVIVDGEAVRSDVVGDTTDLYIENGKAALGGELFGDVAADMTYTDGALLFTAGDVTLSLQLQEDDFMRLILSGGEEGDLVLYLLPEETEEA